MSRRKQNHSQTVGLSTTLPARLVAAILKLPRIARIILAALFAVSVTLALSPIVDNIYLTYLFTPQTVIVPALVSTGFGLAMYVLGWQLVIGSVGENPPARFMILWYVGLGIVAMLLVGMWLINGIAIGNAPAM